MTVRVPREQALAWRLRRQLLDPPVRAPAASVVAELCGVQAQVASAAELATRVRRASSRPGDVARALAAGTIVKTWAMRGALHLLAPANGAGFLAVTAPERVWARWRRYFGASEREMQLLWDAVRDRVQAGPVARAELADAVASQRRLAFAGAALRSSYGEIFKPLAWSGALCFGPVVDGRVTFSTPAAVSPGWPAPLDADEAAPGVLEAYLRAYAPATFDGVAAWLGGAVEKRRLRGWWRGLVPRLAEVEVAGRPAYVRAEDVDELRATRPAGVVRLLPSFDQYVLGPGTEDPLVVPPGRRAAVSRRGGWIAPVVLVDGAIRGTWRLDEDAVGVAWFRETGRLPRAAVRAEVNRLAGIVGRELDCTVVSA